MATNDNTPKPTNFRPLFTNFLRNQAPTNPNVNGCTRFVVSGMNDQMVKNNVPMTESHYNNATESIKRGDTICKFVASENNDVLQSSGSGVVYNMGKTMHRGVAWANQPVSKDPFDPGNGPW